MHAKWARTAAVGVAVLALATACGDSTKPSALKTPSPAATDPSSPSAASDPTPSWSPTEQAVITAYKNFWTALPQASRQVDRDERLRILFPYTTTPELSQLIFKLGDQRAKGQALYGVNVPRMQKVDVTGSKATIRDCQQSSSAGVENLATHRKLTVGVDRHPVTATVLLRGNDWKVSVIAYGADGATC